MKTSNLGKLARIRANPELEPVPVALSTPRSRWAGPMARVPIPAPTRNLLPKALDDHEPCFRDPKRIPALRHRR